jgi:hypothetical protein
MERLAMVAVALGGLLFGACAGPEDEAESVEDQEEVSVDEEAARNGKCDDAMDEGADVWMLMCGALPDTAYVKQQCFKEQSDGRGAGHHACINETCQDACHALDHSWHTYCDERIPPRWENVCTQARNRGYETCMNWCRRRSLDSDDVGATPAACASQSEH